jgi:hypothetical protein
MDVGPLGLLMPKMPESGRVDVEAVADVATLRTAVRIGPEEDASMVSLVCGADWAGSGCEVA